MNRSLITGATAVVALAAHVHASPIVNGAQTNPRVFNDYPGSTLVIANTYPANVTISDSNLTVPGHPGAFANMHNWRASSDGGATGAQFANFDGFSLTANVTIASGVGEAGLNLSPWFAQNTDGQFHIRTTDGEIAAFGGRLPFFSFTGAFGLHYVPGTTVTLGIQYEPQLNSAASPGLIRYFYQGFNSGLIPLDQGNTSEDPPHGLWGITNFAEIGGYAQPYGATGAGTFSASFTGISYIRDVPAPGACTLLGLGGLLAARRRR